LETAFGAFESRSIYALAAPAFAAAAVGRQVLATIPVGTARVLIVARVPIEDGAPADGSSVAVEESSASSVELGGCRILAVVDHDTVSWKPPADQRITAGQELLVVATRRGLATTLRRGRVAAVDAAAPKGVRSQLGATGLARMLSDLGGRLRGVWRQVSGR
jgi:hypothetical protein